MTWAVGLSTGVCTEQPILHTLDVLERCGVTLIELGTPPRHFDPWQRRQVEQLQDRLARGPLRAYAIHAPFGGLLDLSDPNPQRRHATIGAVLNAAAVLEELGGAIVVVHPSDTPRAGRHPDAVEEHLRHASGSLATLANACRGRGVRLAIETPLPHLIGGHPNEFSRLLEAVDTNTGACLDTGHIWLGDHWARFLDIAAGRIIHVHVHDNRGERDDHLVPGDGRIPWRDVFADLQRAAYNGCLMVELHCPPGHLHEHFMRAQQRTRDLLAAAFSDEAQAEPSQPAST